MDKHEQVKLATFLKFEDFRTKNLTILAPYLGVIKDFDALRLNASEIEARAVLQNTDETGTTEAKADVLQILIDSIMSNSGGACSYLFTIGDMINHNKIDFQEYKLKAMKNAEIVAAADLTVKICSEQIINLGDYNVNLASIAQITTDKAAFLLKANLPAEIKIEHKINTTSVKGLFKNGMRIIKFRLTKSIRVVKKLNPTVYNNFVALLHGIEVGVRSHHAATVITGFIDFKAINSITKEAAPGIFFKVVGFDDFYLSDEHGMVEIEMPLGDHIIKIISFEYESGQFNATVTVDDQILIKEFTPLAA